MIAQNILTQKYEWKMIFHAHFETEKWNKRINLIQLHTHKYMLEDIKKIMSDNNWCSLGIRKRKKRKENFVTHTEIAA